MATGKSRPLAQHLERLWNSGTVSGLSDAELVRRFTGSKGPAAEQAFEALLGRHGPMVLGVCRHILRRPQDVDDAFQATFLVLVRKARSIRVDESLGPWLYGVAYRTAIRARSKVARHHLEEMNDLEAAAADPGGGACAWEIRPMLHEELNRLPEKYRSPIVLCDIEGKSHEEAARLLDWPVGTLSGRLSRGRQLLKDRLQRRGLTASAGMLAARLPGEALQALPPRLAELTIKAALASGAGPTVSTSVLTLTQGVLNAMLIHSLKRAALILVSVAAVTGAFGFRAGWVPAILGADDGAAPPRQAETKPATAPVPSTPLPTQSLLAALEPQAGAGERPAQRKRAMAPEAADEVTVENAPPVVVKTVPRSGDTDVDPDLHEIQVTFSKQMLDKSWSWSTASKNTFPDVKGDVRYLDDRLTCVLPVQLQPGRTYATWINSGRFTGFKDRDRRPAVPYLLVFRTRP
jgi:RNA polymerase sigma-70 factor (ECF subfamily)